MPRERQVVQGIVLRSADTKEADKILTVLTAQMGKITVVAKGARGRRSRVTAATELLSYAEMTLSESRGYQYLSEASPLAHFRLLRQDVVLLSLASYFAELTDAVTWENIPSADILSLLLNALYALSELRRPPALVKAAFECRLMALSGFEPLLGACAVCGAAEPERPTLDLDAGLLRCGDCPPSGTRSLPLTPAALAAMRYVLCGDVKRLYSFSLPPEDLERMARAAEAYASVQLERHFATLTFYRELSDSPLAFP